MVRVAYEDPNHALSESQIVTFQKANAISPTATWVFCRKEEGTQTYLWELREDPDKTNYIASAIFSVNQNAFIVFTAADNQRAKDASTQEAAGL